MAPVLYRIAAPTMHQHHLGESVGVLYESLIQAESMVAALTQQARNAGAPQAMFRIEEVDIASEAARELGRRGGQAKSEAKADAARTNGAKPGRRRGRPRKNEPA
jgi:hypothetical protein